MAIPIYFSKIQLNDITILGDEESMIIIYINLLS